jgi:hypothetical protein
MTKVYLLLRNNKQSGPHSLEELLKLGIKPMDLLWVEGRSSGWSYPSEIVTLKPYVTPATETSKQPVIEKKSESQPSLHTHNKTFMPVEKPTASNSEPSPSSKVYVSMPARMSRPAEVKKQDADNVAEDNMAGKIEKKAEELRKKIQSYVPENKPVTKTVEPVTTKYSSTIPEREEQYTSWIYNQKTSKATRISEDQKKWAAIIIAALLIVAVGFGISQFHTDNKKVTLAVATTETDAAKAIPDPLVTEPPAPATLPITENTVTNNTVVEPSKKIVKNTIIEKPVVQMSKAVLTTENRKKTTVAKSPVKELAAKKTAPLIIKPEEVKAVPKKEPEVIVAIPKKKKTLNEKVDAFFSKLIHKKEEAPVVETPPPANNTTSVAGTTERKAIHRDDKTTASAPVVPKVAEHTNLADFVEVTSNKPSESWMLGVHGLKVSLHNNGSEMIKTAQVEMRYYTDQNEVLDKKIVNFNNIPPGKTVTLPAPDHRLADHADFRLVNAK